MLNLLLILLSVYLKPAQGLTLQAVSSSTAGEGSWINQLLVLIFTLNAEFHNDHISNWNNCLNILGCFFVRGPEYSELCSNYEYNSSTMLNIIND